jgi:SAM-dependent methyltransferase
VTVEEVRAFWDNRPCNVRHGISPVGTLDYFREVSTRRHLVEPHIRVFMQAGRWDQRRVLEVGCGIGTDLAHFARHGAAVVGTELSPVSATLAWRRLLVEGLHHDADVVLHDAEVPFTDIGSRWPATYGGDGPPDLIYSFGVLHHTPDPARALRNLRAIAAYETELRVMLYHRWSTKALAIWLSTAPWRWRGAVARRSEAQQGSPVTHVYSRRQARQLLAAAGWQVESMQVRHIFPYRVRDYVQHRYVRRCPWNVLPTRPLDRLLGWHLLIVARPA